MLGNPYDGHTLETPRRRRTSHWPYQKRTQNDQKRPCPQARRCHQPDPGRRQIQLPPAPQMDQVSLGLFAVDCLSINDTQICVDHERLFSEGQVSDHTGAELIYDALPSSATHLIGDKGYDGDEFRHALRAKGIEPCIPPCSNRKKPQRYCRKLYKTRHKVENFFGKLKDWRRVTTRYDRCVHTFMSTIYITAFVIYYLN